MNDDKNSLYVNEIDRLNNILNEKFTVINEF